MIKQYYLGCLSHASYMLVDRTANKAIVVDPQRDIDQYVRDADALGVEIERVVLTHFHADFVAGHLELAARGATIHMGHRAEADYDIVPARDGDVWEYPEFTVEVLETPGHTPEMINLLVTDQDGQHILTGDTLFNGDVGRPDLLASIGYEEHELADMLFESIQRLKGLPDETVVLPAHGAGSQCGKALADGDTTIGEQKRVNYAMQTADRSEFVDLVTTGQAAAPRYFAYNAALNRQDRTLLSTALGQIESIDVDLLLRRANQGAQLVDTRDAEAFAKLHLPGAINIGLDGTYATWCGTVLDPQRPIFVIAEPGKEKESSMRLGRIGYEVTGHLEGGFPRLAEERPHLLESRDRLDPKDLSRVEAPIVDVRSQAERDDGHLPGSIHIPLPELPDRLDEVPLSTVVHCASGYRSSLAASLLRKHGRRALDVRGAPSPTTKDGIVQVEPEDLQRVLATDIPVVDVRESHERTEAHIPGTIHRPMSRFAEWQDEFDEVILQCRSGNRSQTLAKELHARGRRAHNLKGGILAQTITPTKETP